MSDPTETAIATISPPSVTISLATAKVLLAFCSDDPTRPHVSVGVNKGILCATDGHAAIRLFYAPADPSLEGRVWARATIDTAIKVARAMKLDAITLHPKDAIAGVQCLPISQVCPAWDSHKITSGHEVNPALLGRMSLACEAYENRNGGKSRARTGATLVHSADPLDPIVYWIGCGTDLGVEIVIMPMRSDLNAAAIRATAAAVDASAVERTADTRTIAA